MQFSSGYGGYPQNYNTPLGHYSQAPNKAIPSQLDNHYGVDYYSAHYSVPAQNVITTSVAPNMSSMQGSEDLYNRVTHTAGSSGPIQGMNSSASYLHTSISQSYSSFGSPYSTSVLHSASSSVPSQGFVAPSGHYAMPAGSSVAYPNVSYPSMPIGSPYGQVPTSHSMPALEHLKEANVYPRQNKTTPVVQHRAPLGYNSASSATPQYQSTQENCSGNFAGSLPNASNPVNTGIA